MYVPAGTFTMGSETGQSDEDPEHEVTLDGFWIDQTEVTNAQYALCLADDDCSGNTTGNDNHRIVSVTWFEAKAYCTWADAQLPTEAQWEYAARGDDGRDYPWGNDSPNSSLLNYSNNEGGTVPVGSYPGGANWVGALDMAGNVWEWVNDWYDSNYYANSPSENPTGPESGSNKVLRGGSWNNPAFFVRAARRILGTPTSTLVNLGFRCVALPGIR